MTEHLVEHQAFGVRPADLTVWLGAHEWRQLPAPDGLQTWVRGERPSRDEVIKVPTDDSFLDFDENLELALARLQRANGWDPQQLLTQLLAARSDIFYLRAGQFSSDGTIPLREAQELLNGGVELMTAAARSTYAPRAHFTGRVPTAVSEFLDEDLRMGHTQRGSFVMTIIARMDEDLAVDAASPAAESPGAAERPPAGAHAELTEDQLPPFGRRVMSTLASGLAYVHQATVQATTADRSVASVDLQEAVNAGVSTQLCRAIATMTEQQGVRELDLSFEWAPASSAPRPSMKRVVFERPAVPVLEELSDRLAPSAPAERVTSIVGQVVRLERGQDKEEGAVTVEGFEDGRDKLTVRIVLTGSAYTTAVAAHEARGLVEVRGRLVKESRTWHLRDQVSISRMTVNPGDT